MAASQPTRLLAFWLRLLADEAPIETWIPARHVRASLAATIGAASHGAWLDYRQLGQDLGLFDHRSPRHNGDGWIRLHPPGTEGQTLPDLTEADLLRLGADPSSLDGRARLVANLFYTWEDTLAPLVSRMDRDQRERLDPLGTADAETLATTTPVS